MKYAIVVILVIIETCYIKYDHIVIEEDVVILVIIET